MVTCINVVDAVQCNTGQYSTVQYSTAQYSTVQYSTVQYSTVQYSTVQHSAAQCSTVQSSTVQCSAVQCVHDGVPTSLDYSSFLPRLLPGDYCDDRIIAQVSLILPQSTVNMSLSEYDYMRMSVSDYYNSHFRNEFETKVGIDSSTAALYMTHSGEILTQTPNEALYNVLCMDICLKIIVTLISFDTPINVRVYY